MSKNEFLIAFVLKALENSEYWNVEHILANAEKAWRIIDDIS